MARYEGYTSTSMQKQLVELKLDDAIITSADQATWTLTDAQGASLSTGDFTYTATLPITAKEGWYGNFNLPDTPQTCHLHSVIVKSQATMKWHDVIKVKDFA